MSKEYVVRICYPWVDEVAGKSILDLNPDLGSFLECLRYAGIGQQHETETSLVFDLFCPNSKELNSKVWAEQNAERMRTFGFFAAAAPKC